MKFIFEDDPEDIISQFFMSAYPKDVAKKFIYNEANKGNEEAQTYMDYIDTKLKENANTTVDLIGLDRLWKTNLFDN